MNIIDTYQVLQAQKHPKRLRPHGYFAHGFTDSKAGTLHFNSTHACELHGSAPNANQPGSREWKTPIHNVIHW